MENKIKEHIDRLAKKRLSDSVDSEFEKIKKESGEPIDQKEEKRLKDNTKEKFEKEYEYGAWLDSFRPETTLLEV